MKKQKYMGFLGAIICVALIFLVVAYKDYFSVFWFYALSFGSAYIAISLSFYIFNGSWKDSAKQAFKLILIPILIGLIIRFLNS